MRLLQSKQELNNCLFDVIEKSQNILKIVSPFVDFWDNRLSQGKKWDRLIKALNSKKTILEIYTKGENVGKFEEKINARKNSIVAINNLHAKMYINDDTALLSSMNLVFSSFNRSIDFGIITETKEEYNAVLDFFNKNIFIHNERSVEEIKKSVVEYFLGKNIEAEFYQRHCLVLQKGENTFVRCLLEDNNNYPDKLYVYLDTTKNGLAYTDKSILYIGEKYGLEKLQRSKLRKTYYFRLEKDTIPDVSLSSAIHVYKDQILGILTELFDHIGS